MRIRRNLAQWCSSTRLTVLTVGKLKFWKSELLIDMHRSFNIDEHLTEQHWQPVFLFSKPSVSIHVCCSYIELSRSKLHKTGDLQVGNWHVNCQHSSYYYYYIQYHKCHRANPETVTASYWMCRQLKIIKSTVCRFVGNPVLCNVCFNVFTIV